MNRIRRENLALQNDLSLDFHETDNPNLICYSKSAKALSNVLIVVVNLDWTFTQSGWLTLDLKLLGLEPDEASKSRTCWTVTATDGRALEHMSSWLL